MDFFFTYPKKKNVSRGIIYKMDMEKTYVLYSVSSCFRREHKSNLEVKGQIMLASMEYVMGDHMDTPCNEILNPYDYTCQVNLNYF